MNCLVFAAALVLWTQTEWTPDELDAVFLQNAQTAQTLRIQWFEKVNKTDSDWIFERESGEYRLKELAAGRLPKGVTPENRDRWEATWKGFVAKPKPTTEELTTISYEDYWTDRARFQWRFPDASAGKKGSAPAFPDEFTTVKTLSESFRHLNVISGGLENGLWRAWFGSESSIPQGRIAHENPRRWDAKFPPLALPASAWGPGVHWIDFFFKLNPNAVRFEGESEVNGVAVQVVSKIFPGMNKTGWNGGTAIRGYLDPKRGCLPVRLEVFYRNSGEETDLDWLPEGSICDFSHQPIPSLIVRDVKIEHIAGKCFYPVSGSVDHPGRKPGSILSKEPVYTVSATTTWMTSKVEINREIPAEMFNFDFPPNTPFANEPTGGDVWVAGADGLAERVSAGWAPPQTAKRGFPWLRLVGGALCIIATGFGAFYWFRKGTL